MSSLIKRALLVGSLLGLAALSSCHGSFWYYYCADGDYYEQNRVYGIDEIRAYRSEIVDGIERFLPLRTDEIVRARDLRIQVRLDTRYDYVYYDEQPASPSASWSISDWFISSAHASSCGYQRYDDLLERVTDLTVLVTPGYSISNPQTENLTDQSLIIYDTYFDRISEPVRDYALRREYAVELFYLRFISPPAGADDYRFTVRLALDDGYVYERTSALTAIEP